MRVYIFYDCQFNSSIMSTFFLLHDPFDDIILVAIHPPTYPLDAKMDSNMCLTPTYTIELDPIDPSYPSVIQFTLESTSSTVSRVFGLSHGSGFIRMRAVPHGHGHTLGGGCSDVVGGSGNDVIPY